jgi:hypothetical protein
MGLMARFRACKSGTRSISVPHLHFMIGKRFLAIYMKSILQIAEKIIFGFEPESI